MGEFQSENTDMQAHSSVVDIDAIDNITGNIAPEKQEEAGAMGEGKKTSFLGKMSKFSMPLGLVFCLAMTAKGHVGVGVTGMLAAIFMGAALDDTPCPGHEADKVEAEDDDDKTLESTSGKSGQNIKPGL